MHMRRERNTTEDYQGFELAAWGLANKGAYPARLQNQINILVEELIS